MAYDEYFGEGASAASATVNEYVSYAEGGLGDAKATADCDSTATKSCLSVFYMDPNFLYASSSCVSSEAQAVATDSNESWFVHEAGYSDFAHRVAGSYTQNCNSSTEKTPVYLLNDANPAVISFFQSYIRTNASTWDAYYMDDTSGRVLTQAYGPGGGFCGNNPPDDYCTTTQEYPTDAAVAAAHDAFASGMTYVSGAAMKFFMNGVGFSGSTVENLNILQGSSQYIGAVCENCVINANAYRPTMYANVLTAMAQIDAIPGAAFVELNTGTEPSGSPEELDQRIVTTAVAWLGYSPGQTIVLANLEDNTNNLAVWPEDSIVPTEPVESMASSAADIAVAPGVYVREFAQCYNGGVAIGQCAAVLNSTASAVTVQASWLKQKYTHILALTGGDVPSGGTMSLTSDYFVAGVSVVYPSWAKLLLK
ncbi:MAG TPA: hypothetical protein VMG98_01380 [Verrucomicrobiae bacterium]|nr:hypothetical protein [Verrucomicrobiae bacterium]